MARAYSRGVLTSIGIIRKWKDRLWSYRDGDRSAVIGIEDAPPDLVSVFGITDDPDTSSLWREEIV